MLFSNHFYSTPLMVGQGGFYFGLFWAIDYPNSRWFLNLMNWSIASILDAVFLQFTLNNHSKCKTRWSPRVFWFGMRKIRETGNCFCSLARRLCMRDRVLRIIFNDFSFILIAEFAYVVLTALQPKMNQKPFVAHRTHGLHIVWTMMYEGLNRPVLS